MAHYCFANHDKRFVAIASPKCASSAVRRWFAQTAGVDAAEWRAIAPYRVDADRLTELDAYERILFVRDPLRRLVGFYWTWVVCDSTQWCFLDDERELSLEGATFRELVEGIDRARRQGRRLQHHLIAQVSGLPTDRPVDHHALVERLDDEIAVLNRRFGLSGYDQPHPRRFVIDATLAEPVIDHRPEWFDQRRAPAFELFYDAELAAMARRCFAEDVALHASIPGACPLLGGTGDGAGAAGVRGAPLGGRGPAQGGTSTDEIFISIASYCDEFLPFTIRSALEGARYAERLRFGICWQAAEGESLDPYLDDPRFRVIRLPYWESRGYGWSRAEVQKLYRGEKYHLLIDSHSYLAPGWDENLIAQLERKPSAKPLLTTSAPPFTFDARGEVVFPWAGTERDGVPLIRCSPNSANGFLDFQMSRERSRGPDTRTCFMVCNFVFTHGRWIVDVPEDPGMINALHESALAVRTYTHGYDMFLPDEIQVWHLDYRNYREGRRKVWETKSRSWQAEATKRQLGRVDALIYDRGDAAILGRYGRGTARAVEEWAAQAGVDLRRSARVSGSPHGRPPPSGLSVRESGSAIGTGNLVWLASFPRSGNTWVRMFITTYLSGCDRTDLDMTKEYSRSESSLAEFARLAGKPVQELTPEDIAAQRLAVQEHLSNVVRQRVVKTHNARLDHELRTLIFSRCTRAAVYVIRNPLDIVDSLADHANRTLDDTIRLLNDPGHRLRATDVHTAQYVGTWSHHVRTWIGSKGEFPLLVLRYEDLQSDPVGYFSRLIKFLDWDYDTERVRRAVELTSFESLQRAEDASGFAETSPIARSGRFFRHGQAGRFKEVLSAEQVAQVNRDHGDVMKMVGYAEDGK